LCYGLSDKWADMPSQQYGLHQSNRHLTRRHLCLRTAISCGFASLKIVGELPAEPITLNRSYR
jgi:hypothetical protein